MTEQKTDPAGWIYTATHPLGAPDRVKIGWTAQHPITKPAEGKSRVKHHNFILEALGLGELDAPAFGRHDRARDIEKALLCFFARAVCKNSGTAREVIEGVPRTEIEAKIQEGMALDGKDLDDWIENQRRLAG